LRRRATRLGALTASALLVATLIHTEAAFAMTFTVTSGADLVDSNVGNGICQTSAGTCTLRAAIQESNANPAADTVQLPANTYTITRAPSGDNGDDTGDFDIVSPLTIVGAGAATTIVDGGQPAPGAGPEVRGLDRLLEIWEEAQDVTVTGVTFQDGYDVEHGGAIANFSPGLVRLQNVDVKTSHAGVFGGGISTESVGRMEISGGVLSGNNTGGEGGAIYNQHEAELTLTDVSFSDNRAVADGGAVANVSKTRLTITRGTFSGNVAGGSGGGVFSDTQRPATISGSVFTGNEAGDPVSGDGGGGGLYAGGDGPVTISGSTFTENTAVATGGGMILASGAASSVTDTVVRDNHALGGAGVQNQGQGVTLQRLTVAGNVAEADGGGIQSEGSGNFQILDTKVERNRALNGGGFANVADGTLTVSGTTFWDNRATVYGGGVYNASDATALIENTTISGNVAQTSGGGLYSDADAGLRVVNATVTLNLSPYGAGVGHEPGGSVNFPIEPSTSVLFRNSIVAGNLAGAECSFALGSEGGNLDSGDSCYFRGSRDRLNAGNPRIDAIADNGGPTMTHAVQNDSYALDGGVAPCVLTDQRGVTRPKNTTCDMGAYEHEGPFPPADNVDPETQILTGPEVAAERAVFTFAATDNVTPPAEILYECRLEPVDVDPNEPLEPDEMFQGCTNPHELLEFEIGPNTLQVRAIDRAGNVDETPAEWEFLGGEDTTPPETTFASVPPDPSAGRTATFSFQGTDDMTPAFLLEYECRIDSSSEEAWIECASPWSFSDLTTGPHTVEVRAIDEGDNVDPTPATYTWVVGSPTDCDAANVTLSAVADTWVDEAETQVNHGIDEDLTVRSQAPGEDARALIRFAVPTDLPAACELVSATLRVSGEGDAGRTLQAQPLAGAWGETQVTWADQPGVTGPVATADSGSGFREWNVTAAVTAMMSGTSDHGFQIRDAAEEGEGFEQSLASRDTVAEPPATPQLVLRFDGPGAPTPPAPPAGVPTTVTCGMVVTESIQLLNNLTDCPLDGLVVGAPDIRIDLNGKTIDGPGYFAGEPGSPYEVPELGLPAGIRNVGFENVVIEGAGTIRSFGYGVQLMAGTRFNVVEDLTVLRNATSGIELWDADDGRNANVVRRNTVEANEIGISLVSGSENNQLVENELNGNLGAAVWLSNASGNLLRDNEVSGITSDPLVDSDGGILLEDSRRNELTGNRVTDTGDAGIVVSAGSHGTVLTGNRMTRTGDAGILIESSDDAEVTGNFSYLASDSGIVIEEANRSYVFDNDVRFNPAGISLGSASDSTILENLASHTSGIGIEVGTDSFRNDVNGNDVSEGAMGIFVVGASVDAEGLPLPSEGNVIRNNTAIGNTADGISIAQAGHTVTANVAHHNVAWGIDADEEGTTDGGGNQASGNGELEQCRGVVCAPGSPGAPPAPDMEAPETSFVSTPPNPSSSLSSVRFEFTGSDNVAPPDALRFECRLDGPVDPEPEPPDPGEPVQPPDTEGWEECASPVTYHFLLSDVHKFEVRAIDPSGWKDPTAATYVWTVSPIPPVDDTTPPNTTIFQHPDQASTTPVATFGFRGSDDISPGPNLRYECRLDAVGASAWQPCLSPKTYSGLAVGSHTFEARAIDVAGNIDPTPAQFTWTVQPAPADSTAPDTTIVTAPDHHTVSTDATFTFASNEAEATFECSLDGAAFLPCTSPQDYFGLWATNHEFRVKAIDAAGNHDPTPAAHAWTIGAAPVPMTVSCGQTITVSVTLANNLTNCGGNGLVVGAPGITIDLNGFTVDGNGSGAGIVNNAGHDDVTVTNGAIQEFDLGVRLDAGVALNIVTALNLRLNQEAGVQLTNADNGSSGNLIRGNAVSQNQVGIALLGGSQGTDVLDNTLSNNTGDGIRIVASSGNTLDGNRISAGSGYGVYLEGASDNWVKANDVLDVSETAISVTLASNGNRIEGNTLSEAKAGVELEESNDNDVVANEATGLEGVGVNLFRANGNLIEGNNLRFNEAGIELLESSGNRIESNDTSSSSSSGIWIGALSLNNLVVLNTSSDNDAEGISVEAEVLPESTDPGNMLDRNIANGNSSDGIYVAKPAHTISSNVANNNGGWGMYAEVGNIDAGGNRATGNVEPEQCYLIQCDGNAPIPPEVNPPDTLITLEPSGTSTSTSASFSFTGIDDNTPLFELSYECRLDSTLETAWEVCEAPLTYYNLAPGPHTFEVRAVDLSGKVDPSPDSTDWTIALSAPGTPPVTTISSGPPPETAGRTAIFTFFANEADATFECSLDNAAFAACLSPVELEDLLPGHHEFQVRASDSDGNVEPTPAGRTWLVTGPPVVTFLATPDAETANTDAVFTFSANEPVVRFECSVDLAAYQTCTSPVEHTGLALGAHVMKVRAVDADGMTSGEEELALYEWEVVEGPDVTPPDTQLLTQSTGPTATFTFTGTDNVTATDGLVYECRLDSQNEADYVECTSPWSYADLEPGLHTFDVRALDLEENADPSPAHVEWTVTGTPTAPQTLLGTVPDVTTTATTATFTFSSSMSGSTFQCRLDTAALAPCTSPVNLTGLAVGDHEFEVVAISAAGTPDASPSLYEWTVEPPPDTTAPVADILTGPANPTMSTTAAFTFTANEPGVTYECSLDAAAFAPCATPVNLAGIQPGAHQMRVRATDAALNVGDADTWAWTVNALPSCVAPGSVTLGANADSWVLQSSASSNYGTDSSIKVDSKSGGNNARVLVRFNLPAIPSGCSVTSAQLRMYAASYKTGRTLEAIRLGTAWTEANVRWNNQPAVAGTGATVASGSGYRQWTVTSQVGSMYADGNYGFLVRDTVENNSGGQEQQFNSREKGSDNPPRLVITFG